MGSLDPVFFLTPGALGAAIEVTVANIASPTELNSRAAAQGDIVLARTVEAGTGTQTWYYADTTSAAQDLPYVVSSATAGVKFIAVAGAYANTLNVQDGSFVIAGSADHTKTIRFEVDAQTAADDLTINSGAQTDDRTLSVPALTADATLAVLSEAQTFTGAKTFSAVTTVSNATAASTPLVGAAVVGNGVSATSVAIGGGIIYAGGAVNAAQSTFGEQGVANPKQIVMGYAGTYDIFAVEQGAAFRDLGFQRYGGMVTIGTDPGGSDTLRIGGTLTINSATLITTKTSFTNGAGASAGTLANAPSAGNPTKWIPIDDNGTTRYIPAW
jgi:hypothetical protein